MFNNILKWLHQQADNIVAALGHVFDDQKAAAVTTLDGMVRKYSGQALAYVQEAAKSDLSSSEKRSEVWTKLAQQLEAEGHDIGAAGFDAFVNLLVETGVNLFKVLTGESLAQTSPPKDGG